MEQRDAMRRSGSVRIVTLSPEAESSLLQHFFDYCVAMIVKCFRLTIKLDILYERSETYLLSRNGRILNCSIIFFL